MPISEGQSQFGGRVGRLGRGESAETRFANNLGPSGSGWCEGGFCGWPISRIDLPVLREGTDGGDDDGNFITTAERAVTEVARTLGCVKLAAVIGTADYRRVTSGIVQGGRQSDRTRAHIQTLLRHGHTAWPPIYRRLTPLRKLSLFRFKMRCAPFAVRFTEAAEWFQWFLFGVDHETGDPSPCAELLSS